jgi:hypothetical protein
VLLSGHMTDRLLGWSTLPRCLLGASVLADPRRCSGRVSF